MEVPDILVGLEEVVAAVTQVMGMRGGGHLAGMVELGLSGSEPGTVATEGRVRDFLAL